MADKTKPFLVNVDGVNLYAHVLLSMGKEKAIEEILNSNIAIGDSDAKKKEWANKAFDLMVAERAKDTKETENNKTTAPPGVNMEPTSNK